MFKKKPNIKPLAPLRSSDRRKTADQIISDFGLQIPVDNDADPDDKAAATAGHTSLRNALLPDNTQSARFQTTAGPDLKPVSGTVYVGSHDGEEQRILWIKLEEKMYPTVYTLWHNPGIVPLLHTHPPVMPKLFGGSALMTPGLAGGPPFPEKAKKGAVVAIASTENPTVPLVVGSCAIDVSGLQQVQGAKGHAVETIHWHGDEVWAWSPAGVPGGLPPTRLDGWQDSEREGEELASGVETMTVEDEEDGGVSLEPDNKVREEGSQKAEGADGEDRPAVEEELADAEAKEMTTAEIDSAFRKAFLYGCYHYKDTNKDQPNFGLQFPLNQSFVMSNLVQPFLPAFTPAQANQLQIKKTSWKNIKKFIKSLDKEMIIKSKDRDGNEVIIVDIDFDDRHIVDFTPYRLPKKETAAGTSLGRGEKATVISDTADSSVGQRLKKVELFRPKERLGRGPRGLFTAAELRPIVTTYIETENLVSPTNKRLVALNPILANAVFDNSAPIDKEVLAKGSVPRDALIDRILQSCAPFYAILRNDETVATAKPKAGASPKIHITLETRAGNKTMTRVSGLEAYFIPPQPLADELRKACASSTSVDKLVGSSPKNPVMEVSVQGPQKDAVIKALEKRGVNRNWVDFVDKTKGKKKG
ncbi:hypothetical protein H2199_005012 [Coniosporium tulheliwenetii]|uniref:Uncharacterized protein n=1 Tax=Coniosporium tulheliwenetii TaxID=3383036 RepID=A0ACC2Z2E5_9PEZI|nr:hypothetical protein H2199_005012 [Cladosporium sp. JES 115]